MSQIVRPATAFSLDPRAGRKRPRDKRPNHLAWIRTLPCLITGKRPADPAHIRYADPRYFKRPSGMQEKPSDQWVVPLHRTEHDDQHAHNEREWWLSKGIDPCAVASMLWVHSGDDEIAEQILRSARA